MLRHIHDLIALVQHTLVHQLVITIIRLLVWSFQLQSRRATSLLIYNYDTFQEKLLINIFVLLDLLWWLCFIEYLAFYILMTIAAARVLHSTRIMEDNFINFVSFVLGEFQDAQ